MLDVFWGEDGSRKRIACAAANFGTVIRIAHNLIKTHPENISIKRKRKKADRSDLIVNKYCDYKHDCSNLSGGTFRRLPWPIGML